MERVAKMTRQTNSSTELLQRQYYYQELRAFGHDVSIGAVMSKAMNYIHGELVRLASGQASPIGLSFPGYSIVPRPKTQDTGNLDEIPTIQLPPIGDRIRLFSVDESVLERLDLAHRLARIRDYLDVGDIRLLKRKHVWSLFKRYQPNGSIDRLIRRRMKRHGVGQEEARSHFAKLIPTQPTLPYFDMVSSSTQQRYRLFIEKRKIDSSAVQTSKWGFSTYGLSASNPVPDF